MTKVAKPFQLKYGHRPATDKWIRKLGKIVSPLRQETYPQPKGVNQDSSNKRRCHIGMTSLHVFAWDHAACSRNHDGMNCLERLHKWRRAWYHQWQIPSCHDLRGQIYRGVSLELLHASLVWIQHHRARPSLRTNGCSMYCILRNWVNINNRTELPGHHMLRTWAIVGCSHLHGMVWCANSSWI